MGDPEPFGKYLGCDHQMLEASDLQKIAKAIELKVSPEARGMAYDMGGFLALAVARYQQLAGDKGVKLRRVDTPLIDSQALDPIYNGSQDCLEFEDDQGGSPYRRVPHSSQQASTEAAWCTRFHLGTGATHHKG
jgi:hypothetical protein